MPSGRPGRSPTSGKVERKRDAQVRVIGYLRAGASVTDAMEKVGRERQTYYRWRSEDKSFALQADRAVEAARNQDANDYLAGKKRDRGLDLDDRVTGDFVAWRRRYLRFETFPHLMTMVEAMETAGPGGITMILCPPEWAKTTLLEDYITWSICEDPNERIAGISAGQDHARKMIGRIERRLEDGGPTPDLVAHFGPFKDPTGNKPWNADFFTVLSSDHDERDYTMATAGIKGQIRGARWGKIILDDIQGQKTLSETATFMRIFRDDIITRPGKSGRIFIIGSRVGNGDIYEALMNEEQLLDQVVVIPALDLEKPAGRQSNFPPQFHEDGTPITDDRGEQMGWSDEQLQRRRQKVGEEIWAQVYMQQPKSAAGALVTEDELLRACDRSRVLGQRLGKPGIAGLDPALARHAAYTVCEYDAEHLYVTDLTDLYQPRRNEVLFAEIERLTKKHHPTYWTIEANTLQSGLLVDDRFLAIQAELGFRAVPHHTGGQKLDSALGVPALMSAIVRREVLFPGGGGLASPAMALLFDQLVKWRPDVPTKLLPQDMVMSLWFCYVLWRQLRERLAPDLSSWRRSALPDPTPYPFARSNLSLPGHEEPPSREIAYEDHWAQLARSGR